MPMSEWNVMRLNRGVEAYQTGREVVVLAEDGRVLHGWEFLEKVARKNQGPPALVIRNIPADDWNAGNWPESFAALRMAFITSRIN